MTPFIPSVSAAGLHLVAEAVLDGVNHVIAIPDGAKSGQVEVVVNSAARIKWGLDNTVSAATRSECLAYDTPIILTHSIPDGCKYVAVMGGAGGGTSVVRFHFGYGQ